MIAAKTMIYACDENGVIGMNNDIPWKMSSDMKFFKKTTTSGEENHLIMGRKTFESMGSKQLPERIMHVVTSSPENIDSNNDTIYAWKSVEEALSFLENVSNLSSPVISVWVIGGASIYEYCIENNLVDKIIQTVVHGEVEGDTYFEFPEDGWIKGEPMRYPKGDKDDYPYSIVTWIRSN